MTEVMITNAGDRFRKCDRRKSSTSIECAESITCYRFRECDGGKPTTPSKSLMSKPCNRFGECKGGKPIMCKRSGTNISNRVRKCDGGDTCTFAERVITNCRNRARECDGGDTATAIERRSVNCRNRVRECDRGDTLTVIERMMANCRHPPRHDNSVEIGWLSPYAGNDRAVEYQLRAKPVDPWLDFLQRAFPLTRGHFTVSK